MVHTSPVNDQRGFTLIEIMAVLVILGVMASIIAYKYYNEGLQEKAGYAVVLPELNARENMAWSNSKLAGTYTSDIVLMDGMDYDLSNGIWQERTPTNGIFIVRGSALYLKRIPSTHSQCARWERL